MTRRRAVGVAVLSVAIAVALAAVVLSKDGSRTLQRAAVVNVRDRGAVGDGETDDTRAVQRAIDSAPDGATVLFPSGTYSVHDIQLRQRQRLRLQGQGDRSILQRRPVRDDGKIAVVTGGSDITVERLAFDANGITRYGGVSFYGVRGVVLRHNHFFDSRPRPIEDTDRYAAHFGTDRGLPRNERVRILDNRIEDLQLEVDSSVGVEIRRNTSVRAVRTAGIGLFSVGKVGTMAEDYVIADNHIIDPGATAAGIAVHLDPPTSTDCVFRRIRIVNNVIRRTNSRGVGISLGTNDITIRTSGNRFEDISVSGNRMELGDDAPPPLPFIRALSPGAADFEFVGLDIIGNTVVADGANAANAVAFDIRVASDSRVADNVLEQLGGGIQLTEPASVTLEDNDVRASRFGYRLVGSRGRNVVRANRYVGSGVPVDARDRDPTDVVDS